MATWRIWPATSGGANAADPTSYSLSTEFTVTQAGCTITGYWWWCPPSGSTLAVTLSLWSCTTGTTGTQVTAANATSGTLTAGAWNFISCTPTALTANQHYRAEVTAGNAPGNWYGATASYWTTGAGASGIVNGPLTAFSNANALGTVQGGFITGITPAFTTGTAGGGTNYWIDVQVNDNAAATAVPFQPQPGGRRWRRRFRRTQPLPVIPAQVVTIAAGATLGGAGSIVTGSAYSAYTSTPGAARPGMFTPGQVSSPGWAVTTPAQAPGATSGIQPGGRSWRRRFRRAQQVTPATVPPSAAAPGAAALNGAGSVDAAAGTLAAPATLAGQGSVAAPAVLQAAATLGAAASLTAPGTQGSAAALAAQGSLGDLDVTGAGGTLGGAGTLTTAAALSAPAALNGAGSLTAPATQGAGASLAAAGTLTAAVTLRAPATLAGAGQVTASAVGAGSGSGTLPGAGSLAAPPAILAPPAALNAAGTIGVPAGIVQAPGVLAAAGTLNAAAAQQAAAALAAAGTLAAAGAIQAPFTVGTLTAGDAPLAVLTASAAAGGAGGTLTATDQRTGGPN